MKTYLTRALVATAFSLVAVSAAGAAGRFASLREALVPQVRAIVGDDGSAKIAPIVADATARIENAVDSTNRTDRTPRQILTLAQKLAVLGASDGDPMPDLNLTTDQRDALALYARDVISRVRPVLEADGAKIDATLSRDQSKQLVHLREATIEQLRGRAPSSPVLPDVAALIDDGSRLVSPGAFVLLTQLDPHQFIGRR
jgi:hypothetical protein